MFIQESIKSKTYLFSDPHYNHANICAATTSWEESEISEDHAGYRHFPTLKDMNNTIVNGINNTVREDDILFCLGDWSFGGIEAIFEFRKRINCKNVHLIFGNHDRKIIRNDVLPESQQEEATLFVYGELIDADPICAQDLFSSVHHVLQLKIQRHKKQKAIPLFLSHYSHRVWDKHHAGWFHAFGHSHGSLDYAPNGKSMDVGIDCAYNRFGEYRPFSFNEFIEITEQQNTQIIDKHGMR